MAVLIVDRGQRSVAFSTFQRLGIMKVNKLKELARKGEDYGLLTSEGKASLPVRRGYVPTTLSRVIFYFSFTLLNTLTRNVLFFKKYAMN